MWMLPVIIRWSLFVIITADTAVVGVREKNFDLRTALFDCLHVWLKGVASS